MRSLPHHIDERAALHRRNVANQIHAKIFRAENTKGIAADMPGHLALAIAQIYPLERPRLRFAHDAMHLVVEKHLAERHQKTAQPNAEEDLLGRFPAETFVRQHVVPLNCHHRTV